MGCRTEGLVLAFVSLVFSALIAAGVLHFLPGSPYEAHDEGNEGWLLVDLEHYFRSKCWPEGAQPVGDGMLAGMRRGGLYDHGIDHISHDTHTRTETRNFIIIHEKDFALLPAERMEALEQAYELLVDLMHPFHPTVEYSNGQPCGDPTKMMIVADYRPEDGLSKGGAWNAIYITPGGFNEVTILHEMVHHSAGHTAGTARGIAEGVTHALALHLAYSEADLDALEEDGYFVEADFEWYKGFWDAFLDDGSPMREVVWDEPHPNGAEHAGDAVFTGLMLHLADEFGWEILGKYLKEASTTPFWTYWGPSADWDLARTAYLLNRTADEDLSTRFAEWNWPTFPPETARLEDEWHLARAEIRRAVDEGRTWDSAEIDQLLDSSAHILCCLQNAAIEPIEADIDAGQLLPNVDKQISILEEVQVIANRSRHPPPGFE